MSNQHTNNPRNEELNARIYDLIYVQKMSYREVAEMTGLTYNGVRSRCRARGWSSQVPYNKPTNAKLPNYTDFLRLDGDIGGGLMITSDVHAPCTNYELADKLSRVAERYLEIPRRLAILGDFLNYDAFSKYDGLVPSYSIEDEYEGAIRLINQWKRVFDHIYIVLGNHDYRWLRFLRGRYPEFMIVEMLESMLGNPDFVTISIYPFMEVTTKTTGKWHLTHGLEYAQTPLMKARKASNTRKDCHVVYAHQHHYALALDESDKFMLHDIPALVDPKKLAWLQINDTTKPRMKQGFSMLLNGTLYTFSDNRAATDWDFWLR